MNNFQGKVIVITGAGSGLGRSFATQFFEAGGCLALVDLNQAGLEETLHLTGDDGTRVKLFQVDVSDQEAMIQLAQDVSSQLGAADVLINNAGICLVPQSFEETPDDQFRKVLDVNLWGAFYGIRAFLPQLRSRPEACIVNVSSLAGLVGLYGHAAYSISKSALRGLSEALSADLAGSQIQILLVHPGGVKTNLIKNAPNLEQDLQEKAHQNFTDLSLLTSEKTVSRIIRAIQKKRNRLIIGLDSHLILILRALFPRKFPGLLKTLFREASFKDDPTWKVKKK